MRTCIYCTDAHFTSTTYASNRRVTTPDGQDVHYRCLREWFIDDALNRWCGRQSPKAREALRRRLRLNKLPAKGLPGVKQVAKEMSHSFPWVSKVQREAMETFERRVARERKDREGGLAAQERELEKNRLRAQLVEDLRRDVEAVADHLGVNPPTFEL